MNGHHLRIDAAVDVLLPFHNLDALLERAVHSIHEQNGVSVRIIAVDDRPDQTMRPRLPLRHRDILVSTSGGMGYSRALEVGTEYLDAPFVALMNSDDLSLPDRLVTQVNELQGHDICITRMLRITESGARSNSLTRTPLSGKYDAKYLLFGAYGADATWCTTSEWWSRHVYFDDEPMWDWRVALDIFPSASVAVVKRAQYAYRRHSRQSTAPRHLASPFAVIAERWQGHASSFELPPISNDDARVLAMPWIRDASTSNPTMLALWGHALLKSVSNSEVRHDLRRILKRRFAIAATSRRLTPNMRATFLRLAGSELGFFMRDASANLFRSC